MEVSGGVGTIGGTLIGALNNAVLTNGLVLLGVSGLIAGMAVEAVRQLQSRCPDPEYRRGRQRQGQRRGPRQG